MTVGERIRLRRKELKLTQDELGQRLGLKKSAVCRLEREENNITTDRIAKIAKALDTTLRFSWVGTIWILLSPLTPRTKNSSSPSTLLTTRANAEFLNTQGICPRLIFTNHNRKYS